MAHGFEKREEGILEGGYKGPSNGGCRLEGEEEGRFECRIRGGQGFREDRDQGMERKQGGKLEGRIMGGQGIQAEVQTSYQTPLVLG